jgi:hypothetical protein
MAKDYDIRVRELENQIAKAYEEANEDWDSYQVLKDKEKQLRQQIKELQSQRGRLGLRIGRYFKRGLRQEAANLDRQIRELDSQAGRYNFEAQSTYGSWKMAKTKAADAKEVYLALAKDNGNWDEVSKRTRELENKYHWGYGKKGANRNKGREGGGLEKTLTAITSISAAIISLLCSFNSLTGNVIGISKSNYLGAFFFIISLFFALGYIKLN